MSTSLAQSTNWDEILAAEFCYLSWDIFQFQDRLQERFELEQALGERVLKPFDRKKKVVYISHQCYHGLHPEANRTWEYIRRRAPSLSQKFDGFFIYDSCVPHDLDDKQFILAQKQDVALSKFVWKCYVLVVDPYEIYHDRFLML